MTVFLWFPNERIIAPLYCHFFIYLFIHLFFFFCSCPSSSWSWCFSGLAVCLLFLIFDMDDAWLALRSVVVSWGHCIVTIIRCVRHTCDVTATRAELRWNQSAQLTLTWNEWAAEKSEPLQRQRSSGHQNRKLAPNGPTSSVHTNNKWIESTKSYDRLYTTARRTVTVNAHC